MNLFAVLLFAEVFVIQLFALNLEYSMYKINSNFQVILYSTLNKTSYIGTKLYLFQVHRK